MTEALTTSEPLAERTAATEPEPLLWDVSAVCRVLSVGRTRFYASLKAGLFGPVAVTTFGRRLLFRRHEVIDWLEKGAPSRRAWLAMNGRTR